MPETAPFRGRILLVDDEPAFRLATRAFLRQQGFECEAAGGPEEAVRFLSGAPFDLVIADIQMPGNARLEFIEQLAALPGGMRIILLTGHPSMQSAVQSVRLQVAGYLVKPCDPDELVALADQAITRRRSYLAIAANRERLEGWVRDLAQLESVLRDDTAGPVAGPTEAYLNLTLRNLLTALLDLKLFTEALARRDHPAGSLQEAALLKALQETISVLEKTKQSFKSRELGELRKKLEGILQPLN